jgi:hypothetical protein
VEFRPGAKLLNKDGKLVGKKIEKLVEFRTGARILKLLLLKI